MLIQLYLRIERLGTPRAVTDFVYACAYYALQIVAPRVLFPGLWVEEDAAIEQHNQDMQARWEQLTRDVQRRRVQAFDCLLYTSPSPRDGLLSRMPSSA